MSIDTTTDKKISVSQAFRDGFMAAIFRKPETTNPHSMGTLNADAWKKGHKNGQSVVTFHTTRLHTRPSTHWLLN